MGKSRLSTGLALACSACLLAPTAIGALQGYGSDQLASTLVMDDKAVTMLPPRSIADCVVSAEWSPTGKYVLYAQSARFTPTDLATAISGKPIPNPERFSNPQLMAWNKATGKSVRLGAVSRGRFNGGWFAGDETFVRSEPIQPTDIASGITSWRLTIYGVSTGSARSTTLEGVGEPLSFAANNTLPLMAVQSQHPFGGGNVLALDSSGATRLRATIPNHLMALGVLRWLKDGTTLVSMVSDRTNNSNHKLVFIDTKSGDVRVGEPSKDIQYQDPPYGVSKLHATIRSQDAFFGTPTKISVATLGFWSDDHIVATTDGLSAPPPNQRPKPKPDEPTTAFIAADVQQAVVSPSSDAVLYLQNGVALVRDIAYLPLDAYKQMKEAAQRAEIMSRAKQMAMAMLIYAADYDDTMPTSYDPNAIMPYVKHNSVMDGFVYTFTGGPLSKVEYVANTEMGYVSGPGGRAVIYLDGHVKWITNPPPVSLLARREVLR